MWLDGSLTSGSKVMMQFIFFFQRFCIHLDKNIKWNKVGAKMKKSEGLKYIIICGFIGATIYCRASGFMPTWSTLSSKTITYGEGCNRSRYG